MEQKILKTNMVKFGLNSQEAETALDFVRYILEDYSQELQQSEPNATQSILEAEKGAQLIGEFMDFM